MEFTKAHWDSDGDKLRLNMPLSKIDKEERLVSGWATLDNPDQQDDVVLAEANRKAFGKFLGNVREMHDRHKAVGQVVNFKEDSYYDTKSDRFYDGIWVDVYVSRGAQDTWEKVLDGTLKGFSIGGNIVDSETIWVKDANRTVRIVKDYDLYELSLVDSPANPLANIFSITKSNDGIDIEGMASEIKTENVFWCGKHDGGVAKTSEDDSAECPDGHKMENIGWIECDAQKEKLVAEKIAKFLGDAKQDAPANNEGGVDVAEKNEDAVKEVEAVEEGKAENEVESSNVSEESVVEEATDNSEVAVEADPDFAKMFKSLEALVQTGFDSTRDEFSKSLSTVTNELAERLDSKIDELAKANDGLKNELASVKSDLENVEKSLGDVQNDTAIRKSGDLGGSKEQDLTKSKGTWGGLFLTDISR